MKLGTYEKCHVWRIYFYPASICRRKWRVIDDAQYAEFYGTKSTLNAALADLVSQGCEIHNYTILDSNFEEVWDPTVYEELVNAPDLISYPSLN